MKRLTTKVLALVICAAMMLASTGAMADMAANFAEPDNTSRGMFRYWIPDASITFEELSREMQEMKAAGFGGVEFTHVPYSRIEGDLEKNGFGTPAWQQAMIDLYKAANTVDGDFIVDVTLGSQWPLALDSISPNGEEASQELHMVTRKVTAAEAIDAPMPDVKIVDESSNSFIYVDHFVAATLAKVVSVGESGMVLDLDSMQDVSGIVSETGETLPAGIPDANDAYAAGLYEAAGLQINTARWGDLPRLTDVQPLYTADLSQVEALADYAPSEGDDPVAGDYVLFCFYRHGTGDNIVPTTDPSVPTAFFGLTGVLGNSTATLSTVIDEYSAVGTKALTDYWDERILNDELIALMRERGGNFFEDSLEENTVTMFWNAGMLDKFKSVLGYDVTPYLPLLFAGLNGITAEGVAPTAFMEDYAKVLNDCYLNEHVRVIQAWAKERVGFGYRSQSYGTMYLDEGEAASVIDVAEGETLAFGTDYDQYRMVSTGARVGGKNLVSEEALAFGKPYSMTIRSALSTLNGEYAAGMNRYIIHGYSYADTENMGVEGKSDRDQWPGWTTFTSGAGDSWGSRNPGWQYIHTMTDYTARAESLLQAGTQRADIAVLTRVFDRSNYGVPHVSFMVGRLEASEGGENTEGDGSAYADLLDLGYTYDVYSEGVLDLDACTAENGLLMPDGAQSKAIIVDNMEILEYRTLEKLTALAQAGVPVIFAGQLPDRAWGSEAALNAVGKSGADFAQALADLMAMENVQQVATPEALIDVIGNIVPACAYETQIPGMRNLLRVDDDGTHYYYLYNGSGAAVTADLALSAEGTPYRMDLVTGSVDAIRSESAEGVTRVSVALSADEACFVAVKEGDAPEGWNTGIATAAEGELPEAVECGDWTLVIESWGPDAEANKADLTASSKTTVDFGTIALCAWTDIPATDEQLAELGVESMLNVSGIGTYATTLALPDDWDNTKIGYTLAFEHEVGMIGSVTVNGTEIPVTDQINETVDISDALVAGENTVEVRYISTLNNRVLYENKKYPESLFSLFSSDIATVTAIYPELGLNPMFEFLLNVAVHFDTSSYGLTGVEFIPYAIS